MIGVEFEEILPDNVNDGAFRLSLLNSMRSIGRQIRRDLLEPTSTWKHKPKFDVRRSLSENIAAVSVTTEDDIYGWVSEGTEPHDIFPRGNTKALRMPGTYIAKSLPGVLGSQSGGYVGQSQFAAWIRHPGIQARNFDIAVREIWDELFPERMQEALERAADASGHGLE